MSRGRDVPRWGNLRRSNPFSESYGYDRGQPVDRFYIADFLVANVADIRGDVLEVKEPLYTDRFGRTAVQHSHVVDIDATNPNATIVADLCQRGSLPRARFDCFIMTQTLHLLPDLSAALENAWQALAPGGALLITVPTVARVDPQVPDFDFYRLTPKGLHHMLTSALPAAEVQVQGYGNLLASIGFLLGLAAEEFTRQELMHLDASFVALSCARVKKGLLQQGVSGSDRPSAA